MIRISKDIDKITIYLGAIWVISDSFWLVGSALISQNLPPSYVKYYLLSM